MPISGRFRSFKTSLADYRLRQLRHRGGFGLAGEAARSWSVSPCCAPRRAMSALQRPWPPTHHRLVPSPVDL